MPKIHSETSPVMPVLIDVKTACHALSVGRSTLYEILKRGELRSTKLGGKRVLSRIEVEQYANRLIEDAAKADAGGREAGR